jgi:glutamate synthase (NADPH/NADH) small chain
MVQPKRNGKKVAVIGAGPAGLTAANRLNRKGYAVTVYDKTELPGGLLRYGIPNFKLSKNIITRRIKLLEDEGIRFKMNEYIEYTKLPEGFDAYCLCMGAETPRDLSIPGRELKGIHFALEILSQQNRILEGKEFPKEKRFNVKEKKVLVIGGGDTGADCVGTSIRLGAASVTQIEILPQPPEKYSPDTSWPYYPPVLKVTSSHEEGCVRRWSLASNKFIGENDWVTGVETEKVEWVPASDGAPPAMKPTGKKEIIHADLVLLAMGFLKPNVPELPDNVFTAGDLALGPSLVVKAMASGRKAAEEIDHYLCITQS